MRKPPPAYARNATSARRPGRGRGRSRKGPVRSAKRGDALSTTLASGALARLVTYLATRPDEAQHIRALERGTGLTPRSLQTELARLTSLGVIRRQVVGRQVHYHLDEGHPRWRALRALVRTLGEPADVLREALADVPGVEAAFIYGSMALGTHVHEGSDIDVMVLHGDLAEERLARRTLDAGVLLGREVNVVTTNYDEVLERLLARSDFFHSVIRGPKRWIIGDQPAMEAAIATHQAGCG
jgi:predicted nucleotidyltransferase